MDNASTRALAMMALEDTPIRTGSVIVASCVRNEALRLPWFIQYHLELGVDHFFIIDNESTDETPDILESHDAVTRIPVSGSYSDSNCGVSWLNNVLDEVARGCWSLVLDADELLVYPGCEHLSLSDLICCLEQQGSEAMVAPMVDMYPRQAIADTNYQPGRPFHESAPYFDGDGYVFGSPNEGVRSITRGGPRHRLFWSERERDHPSPFLWKIPLIKWREGLQLEASTHILRGAQTSKICGALLHFKFLQDFPAKASEEASRKEHFAGARQYLAYDEVFSHRKDLTAFYPGSRRYENSMQLVDLGIMTGSEELLEIGRKCRS